MKLSNETLSVLKNFAGITSGLFVPEGNKIRIRNSGGTVLAQLKAQESFPSFCVFDLNKFLGLLTVDRDVEMDFKGNDIVLSLLSGKSKINYRQAPQNLVAVPKDTDLTISEEETVASFTLTKENLQFTDKVLSLLGLKNIAFEYEGGNFFIRVFDPNNDGENQQTLQIDGAKIENAESFQLIFSAELFNFVNGDYHVLLADGRAQFKHTTLDVTYWVAPELGSSITK